MNDNDVESHLSTLGSTFREIHPPFSAEEASVEADRCLNCGGLLTPAPCVSACPAVVDIPGFIQQIRRGQIAEASETIYGANVLGGSCARVCPVDELCQGHCVLGNQGRRPIEIARLQRYAMESFDGPSTAPPPDKGSVGVVGAGPAGLACAAELAQLGYAVTVYEKRAQAGGLVVHAIAPYKQLADPMPAEVEWIQQLGVEFRFGCEVGKDISLEDLRAKHPVLFVGAGLGSDTLASLPGESLEGVWESLPFIETLKTGNPDDLQVAGKTVAVIGGGNTAIDVAREAVRLEAERVVLVYRRDEAQMPAYRHEIEATKREGVELLTLVAPLAFLGDKQVTALRCQRMELGEVDSSGRPRPVPIAGSEFELEVDLVVKAIGQQPLAELIDRLGLAHERGIVRVSEHCQSSDEHVFAGGDIISGGATVVEAVRQGKLAAQGIRNYLTGDTPPVTAPPPDARVERDGLITKHFQAEFYLGVAASLCKGCGICVQSCPAEILHLDEKNKIDVEDVNQCVFCGLCETRCPDFAIWIVKDEPIPAGRRGSLH